MTAWTVLWMPGPIELLVILSMCAVPVLLAVGLAFLLYRMSRARAGEPRCGRCGAALAGRTGARCPDCGEAI